MAPAAPTTAATAATWRWITTITTTVLAVALGRASGCVPLLPPATSSPTKQQSTTLAKGAGFFSTEGIAFGVKYSVRNIAHQSEIYAGHAMF